MHFAQVQPRMPYIQKPIICRLRCTLILKQEIIYTRGACHVLTLACNKTKDLLRQNFCFVGSLLIFKHLAQLLRNWLVSTEMDGGSSTNPGSYEGGGLGFFVCFFSTQGPVICWQSLQYPWELSLDYFCNYIFKPLSVEKEKNHQVMSLKHNSKFITTHTKKLSLNYFNQVQILLPQLGVLPETKSATFEMWLKPL